MLSVRAPDDSPVPNFWVGVKNGVGEKNCPYLKGLPPSHHLIGKSHSITNYDVTCGRGVLFPVSYWTPHRGLKIKNREKRTLNCLRQRVWLDVSTFDQCLFTTKQIGFVLILICETSQIFVWRNKAFIFLQKSDILFLHKTRID